MQWSEAAAHLRRGGATVDTYSAVALGWDDEVRRLATADPKSLDFRHWGQTVLQVAVESATSRRRSGSFWASAPDLTCRRRRTRRTAPNVLATAVGAGRPDFLRQLLDRTGDRAWNRLGPGAVALPVSSRGSRRPPYSTSCSPGSRRSRVRLGTGRRACGRPARPATWPPCGLPLKAGVPPDGYPPPDHRERVYDPLVRVMYAARGLSRALHPQSPEDPANPPPPDPDQIRLTTQIFATKLPGLLFPFAGASARTREQMGMAFPLHLAGVSDEIADDRVRIEVADLHSGRPVRSGTSRPRSRSGRPGRAENAGGRSRPDPGRSCTGSSPTPRAGGRAGERTTCAATTTGRGGKTSADGTSVVYALEAAAAGRHGRPPRPPTRPQPRLPFGGSLVMSAFGAAVKAGRVGPMKALTADPANAAAARKDLRWMWTPAARSGSVAVLDVLAGLRKPTDDEVIGDTPCGSGSRAPGFRSAAVRTPRPAGAEPVQLAPPPGGVRGLPARRPLAPGPRGDPNWTDRGGRASVRRRGRATPFASSCCSTASPRCDPPRLSGPHAAVGRGRRRPGRGLPIAPAAGADRRAVDDDKNTALHLAASSGSLEIVELLLKTGADPAARNAQPW